MWVLATAITIAILTVIAWKDRQRLQAALENELDAFLAEVLA